MGKCIICQWRPANGNGYCNQCNSRVTKLTPHKVEPSYFLHYRGDVVGLYETGNGTLRARLLKRSLQYIPKTKLINLDVYCEGYTRKKIKEFKKCVLQLANAS